MSYASELLFGLRAAHSMPRTGVLRGRSREA